MADVRAEMVANVGDATAAEGGGPGRAMPRYCDRCGEPAAEGDHAACRAARLMEPPRYCPRCRRRMIVQVTPLGWTARCSEHGAPEPDTAS